VCLRPMGIVKYLDQYRSVAPTTSVIMDMNPMPKERSFGNVKSCGRRCRSYAPLALGSYPLLQTLSELRSYISLKERPQNIS